MKKNVFFITILSLLLLSFTVFCIGNNAKAKSLMLLSDYQKELDAINSEFGTNYCFPTDEILKKEGRSIEEVEKYFQQMTLNEFKDYVYSAIQADIAYTNDNTTGLEYNYSTAEHYYYNPDHLYPVEKSNLQRRGHDGEYRSYSSTQKWYYSYAPNNYLYIRSTVYYANGHDMYVSVDGYGDHMGSYPCYGATSFTSSISSDKRTVSCNFTCVKYIAPNIMNANIYNFSGITFTANGGDLYASI